MKFAPTLSLVALLAAAPAMADTLSFGQPLVGNGPTASFATLSFTQVGDGDDWQFTLTAANLGSLLGSPNATFATLAFDAEGTRNLRNGLAMSAVSGGVSSVTFNSGGGPTGTYDFRLDLGRGQDRLGSGETASWTWNNSGFASFDHIALQVQGLSGGAAWYAPSAPVPEPASAVLMLAGVAGLSLLRRRLA